MKVPLPNKVCKRCDALGANGADDVIQIEHAITDDLPDRTPTLPSFAEDGIYWALVARLSEIARAGDAFTFRLSIGAGSGL